MINSQIDYNITPGDLTQNGEPLYDWNAEITQGELDILDENGNIVEGRYTSAGDHIVVLNVYTTQNLALIQYPTPEGYRQGYVENSLLNEVCAYRYRNWWQNWETSENVYLNDGNQFNTLPPYSPATILFETPDGYTCIAYGDGNAKPNQSGFVVYPGLFGGIQPFSQRDHKANAETTAIEIKILDYNEDKLSGRYTSKGDSITILDIVKDGQLALIEYPVPGGFRKGFIPNYSHTHFVFNDWDNFTNNTGQNIIVYNNPNLTGELNTIAPGAKATILFKTGDVICVAYNTAEGLHIGSGYISASEDQSSTPVFKDGDTVEIKESAIWFAVGPEVGNRINDTFEILDEFNIDIDGNSQIAYSIKDCRTNEIFNAYQEDLLKASKPAISPNTTPSAGNTGNATPSASNTGNTTPSASNTGNTTPSTGNTGNTTPSASNTGNTTTDGELTISGTINIDIVNQKLESKLDSEITKLTEDINSKINTIENSINQENSNISNIQKSIENIDSTLKAVNSTNTDKFSLLNKGIQSNSTNIQQSKDAILSVQKDLSAKITANSNTISTLQSSISGTKNKVGVVGGINLLKQQSNFGPQGSTSNSYGFSYSIADLYAGRTYTLTVCGQSTEAANKNGQKLAVYIYNTSWSVYKELTFEEVTPTIKQITFTIDKSEKFVIGSYASPSMTNSENVTTYWYNLQEGEIGTSWVPSLYDLSNTIGTKEDL